MYLIRQKYKYIFKNTLYTQSKRYTSVWEKTVQSSTQNTRSYNACMVLANARFWVGIDHIFCDCIFVRNTWVQIFKLLQEKCNIKVNIENDLLLFGSLEESVESEIVNLILLIVKYYIHKCRIKKNLPYIKACIAEILSYKKLDMMSINFYTAKKTLTVKTRWDNVKNFFT